MIEHHSNSFYFLFNLFRSQEVLIRLPSNMSLPTNLLPATSTATPTTTRLLPSSSPTTTPSNFNPKPTNLVSSSLPPSSSSTSPSPTGSVSTSMPLRPHPSPPRVSCKSPWPSPCTYAFSSSVL